MLKKETVGKIGEKKIKNLLTKNNIDFVDMINKECLIKTSINYNDKNGSIIKYSYTSKRKTHPFDLIINNKNFEIKTSRLKGGKFCCSFNKNSVSLINFVILVILSGNRRKVLNYFIFEKDFFSKYKGLRFYNNKFDKLDENELIKKIKYLTR